MRITFEVEDGGTVARKVEVEVDSHDTVEAVGSRIAAELDAEPDEIVEALGGTLGETIGHHGKEDRRIQHRRVCVDLHFETEHARHFFSPQARWANVHRWGCKHFHVAHDACANLELRDGDPQGPALNEARPIGKFEGCKSIWLVKPGAEPNG